jgi:AmiR/NasT family two-component response regulator
MMTGFAENDLVQKALSSGVTTVLYKPLSIEDLLAILDKAVPESFPF